MACTTADGMYGFDMNLPSLGRSFDPGRAFPEVTMILYQASWGLTDMGPFPHPD